MRTLYAFIKKEWMEQFRTGKIIILGVLFLLLGVMNPAIAKLTPWLFETMADSLAESGMTVTAVEVDALTSWVQFFKNIPMGLIAFVLVESSIFSKEFQTGTLILALTKGLRRSSVIVGKTMVLTILWSIYYWVCFGVTYAYNTYFWDNSIAKNLMFAAISWWIFGLWVIALMVLFSVLTMGNSGVLMGTGGVVAGVYFVSMLPKVEKYMPAMLMDGNSLIYGAKQPEDYWIAMIIAMLTGAFFTSISLPLFNKKRI